MFDRVYLSLKGVWTPVVVEFSKVSMALYNTGVNQIFTTFFSTQLYSFRTISGTGGSRVLREGVRVFSFENHLPTSLLSFSGPWIYTSLSFKET